MGQPYLDKHGSLDVPPSRSGHSRDRNVHGTCSFFGGMTLAGCLVWVALSLLDVGIGIQAVLCRKVCMTPTTGAVTEQENRCPLDEMLTT